MSVKVLVGPGGGFLNDENSGGGVNFNIAYGSTAPSDTSKLWIKGNETNNVTVTPRLYGNNTIEILGAALPTAATDMASGSVGSKIYLLGGTFKNSPYRLNTINCFDTETNTISTLTTTLPTNLGCMSYATVGTKIYLFGGYNGSSYLSNVYCFDTVLNTVTLVSSGKISGCDAAAEAIGTKIYIFGGRSSGSNYNYINCFDTETNTVSKLSVTLPVYLSRMASAAVGKYIYLFGGYTFSSPYRINKIYCFNTETNTISELSSTLPDVTCYSVARAIGTKIYIFGGQNTNNKSISRIDCFDTESNTITTLSTSLPQATRSMSASSVGSNIYTFGGYDTSYLSTINKFTVSQSLDEGNILINSNTSSNVFNLINTNSSVLETGVTKVYRGDSDNIAQVEEAYLYQNSAWTQI